MPRKVVPAVPRVGRQSRPARRLRAAVAAVILLASVPAPVAASGAWFTATTSRSGNSLEAAAMGPVTDVTASVRPEGANISWSSALRQTWATANALQSGATYTVSRSVNGGPATTVYTGTTTSASDQFPRAVLSRGHSTIADGTSVSGAISQGRVYTWGKDASGSGQLGTGSAYSASPTAVNIPASHSMTDVSIGSTNAIALASDSTVWAWGSGLAQNCSQATNTPVQLTVPQGKSATAVATVDGCRSLVLASDGTLFEYSGSTGFQTAPALPGGRKIVQITQGLCVLASDGSVWCRGPNDSGQLGPNSTDSASTSYVQVPFPAGRYATQISSNGSTVAVLLNNNAVWAWGKNSDGQLGNGTTADAAPTPVGYKGVGSVNFVKVAVGGSHISALGSNGVVYSSGLNSSGQLGNQSWTSSSLPVSASSSGTAFSDITAGASKTYGVTNNGTVWGWGSNLVSGSSTMGNGDTTNSAYWSPGRAATNITVDDGANKLSCSNGANPNSTAYCAPSGTITYSVSYAYQSWTSPGASQQASTTVSQTGTVTFGGPGSLNMCLGLHNGSSADGSAAVLATCDSSASQTWISWSDGTFRSSGKCLDVNGSSPGSPVQLWPCNQLGFQWWTLRDDGTVYNPTSGLCLTDPNGSTTAGTQMVIDVCNGSWTQRWIFT